jgi:MinD superfamily P-loop ATPase
MVKRFCEANDLPLLGLIPYDEEVMKSDALGAMLELNSRSATIIPGMMMALAMK